MQNLKLSILTLLSIFVIVSCGDKDEITTTPFTASVDENVAANAPIGTVSIGGNVEDVTYTLSNISPAGAIAIGATTGEITVADASVFDFETNTTVTANYTASGEGVESTSDITITILDVDETTPPTFTIWSGDKVTFSKADGADETDAANQDKLTDLVIITRGNTGGQIYNVVSETEAEKEVSPKGTEWAFGTTSSLSTLNFGTFRGALGNPKDNVGTDLVLHLLEDDIYIDVKFTSWSSGNENGGGFSYERSSE